MKKGWAAALAGVLGILPGTAASAAANRVDPAAAMAACRANVPGVLAGGHLDPRNFPVKIGHPGQPMQAQIRAGAVVRLRATGRISYGGVFNWRGTWGPAGNGQVAPARFPYPGGPDAALFGEWNHHSGPFRVGLDSGCVQVPAMTVPGSWYGLNLRANDDEPHDNGDQGYDITATAWLYYGR